MKQKSLLKTMLLLFALIAGSSSVWAGDPDYTYTLSSGDFTKSGGTKTVDGITWTASWDASTNTVNFDNTKGFKFGASNSAYPTSVTLTSSSVTNKIAKVVVTASGNSSVTSKLNVTVGTTAYGSQQTITATATPYEFTPASAAVNGVVTIAFSSCNKPTYVKKIEIYYENASKVATPVISGTTPFYPTANITITCSTENASIQYSIKNGENWGEWQNYTAAIPISETTTIKAKATHATLTASDETAETTFTKVTPLTNIAALVADGNANLVQLTNALVTYKSGNNAYLEDASGAIYLYGCASDLAVGDKITGVMNVTSYEVYSNLPEIKAFTLLDGYTKTTGNTVTPTEVTLATLLADDATFNSYISRYVIIKDATVTSAFSSRKSTISQGVNSIKLYDQNNSSLTTTVNDIVSVTGNVTINSTEKRIAVYAQSQIVVKELLDNAITGINDSYELDLVADGGISVLDLSAATATSGGAVNFSVKSATQENTEYTLDAAELTVSAKGTIVITASVAADTDYKGATKNITVNVLDAPVLTTTSKTVVAGETYTLTAGIDFDADGVVSLSSDNTAIATVDNLTITAVATGTTNINITFAKGTTTKAGSGIIALTVSAPTGKTTKPVTNVFKETFDKCNTQGGNDDKWDQGSGAVTLDNASGIELSSSAYGANKCVRLGTGSNQGSATITIAATKDDVYTLSFKAAPWNTESSTKATVTVTGGNISGISTSNMSTKQWNNYEGTITATATGTMTIVIASSGSKRFFLDEILITKPTANPTVTLSATGYASYCNEYPLDFTTTSGYKAYYVSEVTETTVTFSPITGTVKGGQGIILYGTPSAVCNLAYCESDNVLAGNMLVGTMAPTYITTVTGDYTNFGLSGGSFKKINAGTLPANKAYLPVLTANLPTSASEFTIIFDDATGISRVENVQINNENYYDLQGRKVENPTKGLYIVNGKKVIIK